MALSTSGEPSTVGEFVNAVLLKELWASQLRRLPDDDGINFEVGPWLELVRHVSPTLPQDILMTAAAWVPAIADVTPATLLPDLDQYPASSVDLEGLNLVQRKLLLEALEIVLDTYAEQDKDCFGELVDEMPQLEYPLLQRHGLACVAAQIAALLEQFALMRPASSQIHLRENDIDFAALNRLNTERDRLPAGSKQELVDEMQRCRQHVFDLELDLKSQVKVTEAVTNREKRECDKALARLLTVNQHLEEKLKSRTEDYRNAVKKFKNQDRRLQHSQWLLEEREKTIKLLQEENDKFSQKQSDLLEREREYGRRVVKVQLAEFENLCRHEHRTTRLKEIMDGKEVDESKPKGRRGEEELAELAQSALKSVTAEFDEIFAVRQGRIEQRMEQSEYIMSLKREGVQEEVSKIMQAYRLASEVPERHSAACQTEPIRGKLDSNDNTVNATMSLPPPRKDIATYGQKRGTMMSYTSSEGGTGSRGIGRTTLPTMNGQERNRRQSYSHVSPLKTNRRLTVVDYMQAEPPLRQDSGPDVVEQPLTPPKEAGDEQDEDLTDGAEVVKKTSKSKSGVPKRKAQTCILSIGASQAAVQKVQATKSSARDSGRSSPDSKEPSVVDANDVISSPEREEMWTAKEFNDVDSHVAQDVSQKQPPAPAAPAQADEVETVRQPDSPKKIVRKATTWPTDVDSTEGQQGTRTTDEPTFSGILERQSSGGSTSA